MKYIQLAIILLFTIFTATAQTNQRYIEVGGTTNYQRQIERFEAVFTINATRPYSYNKEQSPTLKELKKRFFQKTAEMGLEKNKIQLVNEEERKHLKTLENENTISYIIKTTDEREIPDIILLKDLGAWIYKLREKVIYKPFINKEEIIARSLKDARKNADVVAKAINATTGEILSITDYYYEDKLESTYYSETAHKYRIAVRFAIK